MRKLADRSSLLSLRSASGMPGAGSFAYMIPAYAITHLKETETGRRWQYPARWAGASVTRPDSDPRHVFNYRP